MDSLQSILVQCMSFVKQKRKIMNVLVFGHFKSIVKCNLHKLDLPGIVSSSCPRMRLHSDSPLVE